MRLNARTKAYLEELRREDPNRYQDVLRSYVDAEGMFTPRQSVTASGEVFEDAVTGELVSPLQLAESLAGVEIDPETGAVAGYRNAATARDQAKGKYLADISVNKPSDKKAASLRIKDVNQWAGDQAARAFFDPGSVDVTASPSLLRAALMGRAASTGDGAAMIEANKVYDITPEYRDEFLKIAKIGNAGFGSSIRKSGLDEGRALEVIDPATGQRVVDLGGRGEKEFYEERINDLTDVWLQGGGRGLNDLHDDIAIPGNEYQMEHNNAFSQSNHLAGAETPENRVGFYRRYVNSEKGDMDTQEYYQQGRLALLANDQGINISGVNKGPDARTSLSNMMEVANPTVIAGDRRRKDNVEQRYPERAIINSNLVDSAMEPQDAAQAFLQKKIGNVRDESPDQERDLVINSGGGNVTIGDNALRKGKNGNGNGH